MKLQSRLQMDTKKGSMQVDARYYRHLFQYQEDTIIQSGSILDTATETRLSYVYLSGSDRQDMHRTGIFYPDRPLENLKDPLEEGVILDLCILGSYTYSNIIYMLQILKSHPTCTVILPYLTPLQRLHLAGSIPTNLAKRHDLICFLDYPYDTIRRYGVENIYFLSENGEPIREELDFLTQGYCFTMLEDEQMQLITDMEGQTIPVVKSGYIRENQWLFYFGTFGPCITDVEKFMVEYAEKNRRENETDYPGFEQMLEEFETEFGEFPYPVLLMYHGPLWDNPMDSVTLMVGKHFPMVKNCRACIPKNGINCALRCQHDNDYEYMQYHKNKERNRSRMGILHMGNANLSKYLEVILQYFDRIIEKTRVITLLDCVGKDNWDEEFLHKFICKENIYWITPVEKCNAKEHILQIITFQPYDRMVNLNDKFGYCMSGYLIPNGEI